MRAVIEVERALRVVLSNVVVDKDGKMWLETSRAKELENKTFVRVELGVAMPIDQLDS